MHKIPEDIRAYLDKTPALTKEMVDELAKVNRSLCKDPEFLAEIEGMAKENEKLKESLENLNTIRRITGNGIRKEQEIDIATFKRIESTDTK